MRPLFVLLAALAAAPAAAQDGQVVLTAWPTRAGSISAPGTEHVVLVRWDVTEGDLPATLDTVTLVRDGTTLGTWPAHGHLGAAEIEALYLQPHNARRLAEILRWLDDEDPAVVVDVATFAEVIVDKLDSDTFWAWQAARIDPTIAIARYRATVDPGATGTVTYRLDGSFAGGAVVTLGKVTVNADADVVVPAAPLQQIPAQDIARCDAPEAFRAHGTVSLDWGVPGAAAPERFAWDQSIAGWDLYRSDVPATAGAPLVTRDLRAEAALLPHDDGGRVAFPGLVKVNDQPIQATSDLPPVEPGYDGWAPAMAQWTEVRANLEAAGITPGDERAWYLVARDVTGNYGQTAALMVSVPDLEPPPAPFGVHAVSRPAGRKAGCKGGSECDLPDRTALRWPEMSLSAWVREHPRRTYCNLEDAKVTNRLVFVDQGVCPPPPGVAAPEAAGVPVTVNLDIGHYLVYRFETPEAAGRFTDGDGDGFADLDERPDAATPGAACNPKLHPDGTGARVAVLGPEAVRALPNGRRIVEYVDDAPGGVPGRFYWYRVAALATGGALSPLSAPVRAMFPAYRRVRRNSFDPPPSCQYGLLFNPTQGDVGRDYTGGSAVTVRLECEHKTLGIIHTYAPALVPGPDYGATGGWPKSECDDATQTGAFYTLCHNPNTRVNITYLDANGDTLAGAKKQWDACTELLTRLHSDCIEPKGHSPNEVTLAFPEFDPEEGCVDVYRDIGGTPYRIETVCDELTLTDYEAGYEPATLGASRVCLYTRLSGASGPSALDFQGCEEVGTAAAAPPEPLALTFDAGATTAAVAVRPPDQRVLGTIVEWRRDDGSYRASQLVPAPSEPGVLGEVTATIDLGVAYPPADLIEVWCFRARTVLSQSAAAEVTDTLSDWSADLCAQRIGQGGKAPTYIPWPRVPAPPAGEALDALYLDGDGLPVLHLGPFQPVQCTGTPSLPTCHGAAQEDIDAPEIPPCLSQSWSFSATCEDACDAVREAVEGELGFVAYRQERASAISNAGDYVQVSPLIDRVQCTTTTTGQTISNSLGDPFIAIARFQGTFNGVQGAPWSNTDLIFVDRYPHILGKQYRYQLVYFDGRGEISRYRTSNWITAEK